MCSRASASGFLARTPPWALHIYRGERGRLKRHRGWKSHLLEAKSPKRRRHLRHAGLIAKADEKRLKVLVPYL